MKRSWSQELVATAELVGVEIRHMSNPIHMVRAIREGLEALLLQRAQEIEQVKALLKTGADLLRRAPVAEGSPFIAEAVAWLREPGVPGTSSATFMAEAALVSCASQSKE